MANNQWVLTFRRRIGTSRGVENGELKGTDREKVIALYRNQKRRYGDGISYARLYKPDGSLDPTFRP